jgi:outer membrane protein TolC
MNRISLRCALLLCSGLLHGAAGAQASLSLTEAIRLALVRSPDIDLQRAQQRVNEGQAISAAAPFDTVTSAGAGSQRDLRPLRADERLKYFNAGPDQQVNLDSLQFGASRLLESGALLSGAYVYGRTVDNLQSALNVPRQDVDRLSFTLRLPLQRNTARDARATRNAAELEADAARRDTEQTVARTIYNVTQNYWDWSARQSAAAVAVSAEARMLQLKSETEKLIEQDELPPAELNLLQAAVTERVAARIGAQQRERDARFALGRLYGMNADETAALGGAAEAPPEQARDASQLEALRRVAVDQRADLQSLRLREQAMLARLDAARENNKPAVDLEVSGYYAGLKEGTRGLPATSDPTVRTAGPGVSAKVSLQWPIENSANQGALRVASASADAARVRRITLEQTILGNVEAAYQNYAAVIAQLRASNETVQRYRTALRDIQTKRLLGSATLIDVLNLEDRLNTAILARLQYQQGYAAARAQILFETGALVSGGAGAAYVVALDKLLP